MGFGEVTARRKCELVRAAVASDGGRNVEFVRPQDGLLAGILDSLGSNKHSLIATNGAHLEMRAAQLCRKLWVDTSESTALLAT